MTQLDPERRAGAEVPPVSDASVDLTASAEVGATLVPPEVVSQTLREYLVARWLRLKTGDSGVLPVIIGLIAITIVFQTISPNHVFLSPGNVVNLFQQSAFFMVFAMAEIQVMLLGDIDLSIGFVGPVGGVIAVQLVQPSTIDWPWWAAIIVALLVCAVIGAVQGTLITRLRLPSFIVTLGTLNIAFALPVFAPTVFLLLYAFAFPLVAFPVLNVAVAVPIAVSVAVVPVPAFVPLPAAALVLELPRIAVPRQRLPVPAVP